MSYLYSLLIQNWMHHPTTRFFFLINGNSTVRTEVFEVTVQVVPLQETDKTLTKELDWSEDRTGVLLT